MSGPRFILSLFHKFVVRDCLRDYVRTLLTIGGIALGVAVFLAITLSNNTALSSFAKSVDSVAGKCNLEIRPVAGRTFDQEILRELRWLWSAGARFTPLINTDVAIPSRAPSQPPDVAQLVGIDMMCDDEFKILSGAAGDVSGSFEPGSVLVGHRLAADLRLSKGESLSINIGDSIRQVQVVGMLPDDQLGSAWGGRLIVCDISLAQQLLDLADRISQIEILAPPESLDRIRDKLNRELPDNLVAETAGNRSEKVEKMTRSFEYNLWALTFIALLVGMFLIYNTITISVIRRRKEIGTLRALGVQKSQILMLVILEAALFGALGSTIGVCVGILMSSWSLRAVAITFRRLYFNVPMDTTEIAPAPLLIALGIGMVLTVVAAVPPAFEGASVAPQEATREHSQELKTARLSGPLALFGVILLVLAWFLSTLPAVANFPFFGYGSALFVVFGFSFLIPLVLRELLPYVTGATRAMLGLEGRLAVLSLQRTLGRTSIAVATLAVGISMMISLAIMIGSFRDTVTKWAEQTLVADLWMRPAARDAGSDRARFPASMEERLKQLPQVLAVEPWTEVPIDYKGYQAMLGSARFEVVGRHGNLTFLSGSTSKEVCDRLRGNHCIVSETFAVRHQVRPGDRITIPTRVGQRTLKVEDIYYDYVNDSGYIVLDRATFSRYMKDDTISSFAIIVSKEANPRDVRRTIFSSLGRSSVFVVRTTGELRERILQIFDRTFAVTYALHTIAVAVAILSVMNALLALASESRREHGMLRYLGMSASGIRKMVLVEAGVLGILGSVLGTIVGFVLSLLLIYVINKQSFGWTIQFMIPFDFIAQSFLIVVATSVLSGLIPARAASRTPAPEVVRYE